jgi:unsaturated chondroitin disaccharide hydrolase
MGEGLPALARISALLALAALAGAAHAAPIDLAGINSDLKFVEIQAEKTVASLGSTSLFPISGGETGPWATVDASDWTSGFFPGELWLLYQATGSPRWKFCAEAWTASLASQATRRDTHDVGFIIGTSFGNAYRLTGDPAFRQKILVAAASLAQRYNPKVGAIRSWDFGPWLYPVIVDNMMNLGPLQWGASHGGAPIWAEIAAAHAGTTSRDLVRADGSTFHVADFDAKTGALIHQGTSQGFSDNSTWARGQAWALYGFVQAYRTTGNAAFLSLAKAIANYFVRNLPPDDVPYWDLNARVTPSTPRDTSAAAIAADGLIMLSELALSPRNRAAYLLDAENMLGSLSAEYLAPPTGEAVLAHGTGSFPANSRVDTALIFGDYYFTEALLRLRNHILGGRDWLLYSPTGARAGRDSLPAQPACRP